MKRTLRAQSDFKQTLLRNQLTSLILFESVTTTKAKAKQLIPFANHFFNRVRSGDYNSKRLAGATLFDVGAIKKTFEEVLPRYNKSETTFVRYFRVLPRKGDSAEMVMVSILKPLQAKPAKVEEKTDKTISKAKIATKKAK